MRLPQQRQVEKGEPPVEQNPVFFLIPTSWRHSMNGFSSGVYYGPHVPSNPATVVAPAGEPSAELTSFTLKPPLATEPTV